MENSHDDGGCNIQLPPPMPLLLQSSTANGSSLMVSDEMSDQKLRASSVSSSSSSPTCARASSSDINDDSVCCSASNCSGGSKSLRVIGDSGVNSSDDCGSLNADHHLTSKMSQSSSGQRLSAIASPQTPPSPMILLNSLDEMGTPSKQQQTRSVSNVRPVSPALSHVSFGMEPKFQILTDISTTATQRQQNQNQNEDFQTQQQQMMYPHFISNTMLPPRYFAVGTNPRSVRASTPTTVRKVMNPSMLLSTSHHQFPLHQQQQNQQQMYIDPITGMPVYLPTVPQHPQTLPRHHVVRIVESEDAMERRHQRDQRAISSDDESSSSDDDDDDSRIFSNSLRRGRAAFHNSKNSRRNGEMVQQKSRQIEYFQPRGSMGGHQLSTIPEQVESSMIVTSSSNSGSLVKNVSKVVSYVYVLLICTLSIAFLMGESDAKQQSIINPVSAMEVSFHRVYSFFLINEKICLFALFGKTRTLCDLNDVIISANLVAKDTNSNTLLLFLDFIDDVINDKTNVLKIETTQFFEQFSSFL